MPLNFREGMRRLGIVASVLGGVAAGIRGYFLAADTYALSAYGFRRPSWSVTLLRHYFQFWDSGFPGS